MTNANSSFREKEFFSTTDLDKLKVKNSKAGCFSSNVSDRQNVSRRYLCRPFTAFSAFVRTFAVSRKPLLGLTGQALSGRNVKLLCAAYAYCIPSHF